MSSSALDMPTARRRVASSDGRRRARRFGSAAGVVLSACCALVAAAALLLILGYVVSQGIAALNVDYLVHLPRPVGVPGGGVANGILGSILIVGLATIVAAPLGVLTGTFLALYGRGPAVVAVRFLSDVLSGVPSIVVGLFAYVLLVAPFKHFSGTSAAFAFAILMLPLVIRSTDSAVRSVSPLVRQGALALGLSQAASVLHVVLPAARPANTTGLLLAVARVTGETAPLLFTAFGSQFWETNPNNPIAELSLQVFTYAISPYREWQQQAWAGALLLILAVFAINVLARVLLGRRSTR